MRGTGGDGDGDGDGDGKKPPGSTAEADAQGAMGAMAGRNYVGSVELTGDKSISTVGEIGNWTFTIAGQAFDFNPITACATWPGVSWVKASITLVISFALGYLLVKTVREAQTVLQTQTEVIGNTNASVTFLGFGVTSTSVAALAKLAIYATIVATLAVTIWAVGASYDVTPSFSKMLFSQGAPAFAWTFFNLFLPMDLIGAAPVTAVLIKFFGWSATIVSSMVMKAASTI